MTTTTTRPAYTETLQRRLGLGGADAPIDVGLGCTFLPRSITAEVKLTHRNDEVSQVCLTVYGTVEYRGQTDSGAMVTITYSPASGRVSRWTRSTLWSSTKLRFTELPEGRRRKISEIVVTLLGDVDWQLVSTEQQWHEVDLAVERQRRLIERESKILQELQVKRVSFSPMKFDNDVATTL